MRSFLTGCIVIGLAWSASGGVQAQTLEGRVLDGTSHQPLADARLQLLAPEGTSLGDPVTSGEDGSFMLRVPGSGSYYVRVELLSYQTLVDGIFEFEDTRGRMPVTVYLQRTPIELEGIEARVEAVAIRRHLRAAGFYERAAAGFGDFFGPEQIESRMANNLTDHFRAIPGIRFESGMLMFRSSQPGQDLCMPNVWLDGTLILSQWHYGNTTEGNRQMLVLDDIVSAQDVAAMEVYRTISGTPLQWTTSGTRCGTVVIWTKQGR